MDTNEIGNKVKDLFEKGTKATKEALEKAGDKVQDFTDKSVVKIEKHQLENKRDLKYEEMGLKLSQMLIEGAKVTSDNADDVKILEGLQEEIKNLSDQIREKENLL
ncbi:MAG: hypothetical protein K6C97_00135 [Treponema sp.]|nr:hypothetical protein [Treponema sp.]